MKIYFKRGYPYKRAVKKVLERALVLTENNLPNLSVSLCCLSPQQMRVLNCQQRNIDKATDVLSFPFTEITYKSHLSDFEAERDPNGELFIGEIYVCKKIAKKQAREYGHSYKREVCFLSLHGFLHTLGYDHINKSDEKIMMQTADKILQSLKITR